MIIPMVRGGDSKPKYQPRPNVVAAFVLIVCSGAGLALGIVRDNPFWFLGGMLLGLILMLSPKVAKQWEKGVVLRLGKFVGLRGPGLFFVVPLLDTVSVWIDQRVITTSFAAEQTLTRDTVPVNVDAVLFWMVYDPEKAALEVQEYRDAVSWAAQTALRDIIGRTNLQDLLRGRERIEEELQKLIDQRSNPWGVTVQSVEMRDVVIPDALQDAMSREAQAAREKQARIILSEAEVEIAKLYQEASISYQQNPTAPSCQADSDLSSFHTGEPARRSRGDDLQLSDLAVQRRQADVQPLRRLALVRRLPQDALDVLLLEALRRLAQPVHQARVALDRGQVGRQVGRRDERPLAEDHRPLQCVVEFAHVAAPLARQQELHRLVTDAVDVLADRLRVLC